MMAMQGSEGFSSSGDPTSDWFQGGGGATSRLAAGSTVRLSEATKAVTNSNGTTHAFMVPRLTFIGSIRGLHHSHSHRGALRTGHGVGEVSAPDAGVQIGRA